MRRIADQPATFNRGLASGLHYRTAAETALVESEWADANVPDGATSEERAVRIRAHFDAPKEKRRPGCAWRGWNNGRTKKPLDSTGNL